MKHRLHAFRIGVTVLMMTSTLIGVSEAADYVVHKGDTLWGIAKKAGVPIDVIKKINGVSANKPLPIGTKLIIPDKDNPDATQPAENHELTLEEKDQIRFGPRVAQQIKEQSKADEGAEEGRSDVVRTALAYRGARYVRGGTGLRGFDCSGFTRCIYKKYGVNLPHSSRSQAACGAPVSSDQLKPGDLVFFATSRRGISHVGLYIGNRQFIHASTPRRGVMISSLDQKYYASRYRGARRIAQGKYSKEDG